MSRAPLGAESAADALGFVLDDGARLAWRKLGGGHTVAVSNQGIVALIALNLRQIHQAQAVLRTDIHASGAQDALRAIENRIDLALQAAQPFGASLDFIESQF